MLVNARQRRNELGQASIWIAGILLAVAAYLVLTFLPPWYKSWKAKNVVGEAISGMTLDGMDEYALKESIVGKLKAIGVDVAESDVEVEVNKETRTVRVNVDWKASVKYPFTKKRTTVNFYIKVKRKTG